MTTWVAFVALLTLLAMSAFPRVFSSGDPFSTHPELRLRPPGQRSMLGTDYLGRDLLARVVYGARFSLLPPLAVVGAAATLGILAGLIAGYAGGWIDEAIMRIVDVFLAVPALILAMAIVVALQPSIGHAALAVILVWWSGFARLVRGQTLVLKETEYVLAAQALGAGPIRTLFRHIFPNQLSTIIVKASLDVGTVLLTLSGLGFLGIAAQPPTPEWGIEVATATQYMFEFPWYVIFPGAALFVTVYSVNVVGDAVREYLDPRLRNV